MLNLDVGGEKGIHYRMSTDVEWSMSHSAFHMLKEDRLMMEHLQATTKQKVFSLMMVPFRPVVLNHD